MHLQIDVLYLFKKYLFNISEYKAMLIKLLIYHINIGYVCVCVCVWCVCVINKKKLQIRIPLKYRIDKRSNTV